MNKTLGIIGAIVVIALVVYFAMANKGPKNEESNTQPTSQNDSSNDTDTQTGTQKNSLKGLLGMNAQQCTYSEGQSQGTVYTANGKARMDITSVTNGVSASSHAIIQDNTYYGWVDGQTNGFKFSTAKSASGSAGSNQNVDVNKEVDYNCSGWTVDATKFALPANITFMDMSSIKIPTGN